MNLALRHHAVPDSPLSRWDARWKLAGIAVVVAAIAAVDHLLPALAALFAGILVLLLAKLPRRWVRSRLALFALAALPFLLVLPFTMEGDGWNLDSLILSERGLIAGTAVFARGLAIGCFALVLVGTAPLPHTFAAAHRLGIPGVLVQVAMLALRYAYLLSDEWRRLRVGLWVRGFRPRANRHGYRTMGYAAGAILVRGADRGNRVADAMRCRGFHGRFHSLVAFHTNSADVISCLLALLAASGLVIWDRLFLS